MCSAAFFRRSATVLGLSFALADAEHLESLFADVGFRDISVERATRPVVFDSIDEYLGPN